jgi:thiol-disulfide isomerase/thioredoxin
MKRSVYVTFGVMLVIVCVGLLYIFFFLDPSEKQRRNETPAAIALLPAEGEAQFMSLSGDAAPLDESFGKVLVVFSWASWCPQCGADLQQLQTISGEYPREEVEFIAINRAEDRFTAERYLSTLPPLDGISIRLDSEDHFFGKAQSYAMPEMIVYGQSGDILLHSRGQVNQDELKEVVKKALE